MVVADARPQASAAAINEYVNGFISSDRFGWGDCVSIWIWWVLDGMCPTFVGHKRNAHSDVSRTRKRFTPLPARKIFEIDDFFSEAGFGARLAADWHVQHVDFQSIDISREASPETQDATLEDARG